MHSVAAQVRLFSPPTHLNLISYVLFPVFQIAVPVFPLCFPFSYFYQKHPNHVLAFFTLLVSNRPSIFCEISIPISSNLNHSIDLALFLLQ